MSKQHAGGLEVTKPHATRASSLRRGAPSGESTHEDGYAVEHEVPSAGTGKQTRRAYSSPRPASTPPQASFRGTPPVEIGGARARVGRKEGGVGGARVVGSTLADRGIGSGAAICVGATRHRAREARDCQDGGYETMGDCH